MTKKSASPEKSAPDSGEVLHATEARAESMLRMYLAGHSISEIAQAHSISESTVYRTAKEWGWKNHKKQLDKRRYRGIAKNVAAELDAEKNFQQALAENQIKRTDDGRFFTEVEIIVPPGNKYPFGPTLLSVCNDPEKAVMVERVILYPDGSEKIMRGRPDDPRTGDLGLRYFVRFYLSEEGLKSFQRALKTK